MKGFTLIELLVVVLIIGILAAVAVPQYQKAVAKTRAVRLLPLLRAISDAENVFYMANGHYAMDFSELDIAMPAGAQTVSSSSVNYGNWYCYLRNGGDNAPSTYSAYCNDLQSSRVYMEKYFSRDTFICWSYSGLGSQICKSISGKNTADTFLSYDPNGKGFYF